MAQTPSMKQDRLIAEFSRISKSTHRPEWGSVPATGHVDSRGRALPESKSHSLESRVARRIASMMK